MGEEAITKKPSVSGAVGDHHVAIITMRHQNAGSALSVRWQVASLFSAGPFLATAASSAMARGRAHERTGPRGRLHHQFWQRCITLHHLTCLDFIWYG